MGFKLGKNKVRKTSDYKYFPNDTEELEKIIYRKYIKFFNLGGIATKTIELDLNDINISEINDLSYLFGSIAKQVEILDISEWDTSKVVNMIGMFDDCDKLKEIKGLENLDVSNVKYMTRMFKECTKLESIDISHWELHKNCKCLDMFMGCENLKEIKGIDILKDTKNNGMFFDCNKLKKPEWYTK